MNNKHKKNVHIAYCKLHRTNTNSVVIKKKNVFQCIATRAWIQVSEGL